VALLAGEDMSIIRKVQRTSYTVVDNGVLNDSRLSWKATGMLAYLLSLPDGWRVNHTDLATRKRDGKDGTLAAMHELEVAGYIVRRTENDRRGHITTITYVYEEPVDMTLKLAGSPDAGLPGAVSPSAVNPALVKTEEVSTEEVSTQGQDQQPSAPVERATSYPPAFEAFWNLCPVKRDKRKALAAWRRARKRADDETINRGMERYTAWLHANPDAPPKYPEGWLNGDRWDDEMEPDDGLSPTVRAAMRMRGER
jgi:hypothetical protein